MKFLLDFLPILLFFGSFKWAGAHPEDALGICNALLGALPFGTIEQTQAPILLATLVTIAATVLQIVLQKWMRKPVDTMQWVALAIVLVLGGATLVLHDETFIKLKPTALYWTLGLVLAVGQWILDKLPMKAALGKQIQLPDAVWKSMGSAWALFFAVMGAVNWWVARTFETEVWVNFKLFGTLGATLVFIVLQSLMLAKHLPGDQGPKS